jgi:hypothetical protein
MGAWAGLVICSPELSRNGGGGGAGFMLEEHSGGGQGRRPAVEDMVAGSGRGWGALQLPHATCTRGPSRLELALLFASTSVMCRWGARIGLFIGSDGIQLA